MGRNRRFSSSLARSASAGVRSSRSVMRSSIRRAERNVTLSRSSFVVMVYPPRRNQFESRNTETDFDQSRSPWLPKSKMGPYSQIRKSILVLSVLKVRLPPFLTFIFNWLYSTLLPEPWAAVWNCAGAHHGNLTPPRISPSCPHCVILRSRAVAGQEYHCVLTGSLRNSLPGLFWDGWEPLGTLFGRLL